MRLVQVAQRATDLDRAAAFYERLLGTPPTGRFDPPGLLFFDLDGVRLLLEEGASPATLYLDVGDVRAAVERVRAFAEVVDEPHVIFHHDDGALGPPGAAGCDEWQAFVRDSEGSLVGLVGFEPAAPRA